MIKKIKTFKTKLLGKEFPTALYISEKTRKIIYKPQCEKLDWIKKLSDVENS